MNCVKDDVFFLFDWGESEGVAERGRYSLIRHCVAVPFAAAGAEAGGQRSTPRPRLPRRLGR